MKRRVLLIEPDNSLRQRLVATLRAAGYEVAEAVTTEHCLCEMEGEHPDVVVCRCEMPADGCREVIESVHSCNPTIPVIVISESGSVDLAVETMHRGAFDFVSVVPRDDELLVRVKRAVDEHDRLRLQYHFNSEFRVLLENIPDLVFGMNQERKFTVVSHSVNKVLGYEPAELIGKSPYDLMPAEDRTVAIQRFAEAMSSGEVGTSKFEVRLMTREGEIRHFEVHRRIRRDESGVPLIEGVARDITDRRRMEAELREYSLRLEDKVRERTELLERLTHHAEELQAILNSSQSSIVMVNNEGTITARNIRVRPMFGLVQDPIRGTSFDDFKSRIEACFEDTAAYRKLISDLDANAEDLYRDPGEGNHDSLARVYERALKTASPEAMDIAIYSRRVRGAEGAEIGRVWMFENIAAAKRSDAQLRTIIAASPVPLLVSRIADGRILYANQPLADVFGVTQEQAIGQVTLDFYANPQERADIVRQLMTEGNIKNREMLIRRRDGSTIWMILHLEITTLNGEMVTIGGLYDINKRKLAEEQLAKRLRYEEALAACTQALLAGEDTDATVRQVLDTLRIATHTNSVYIFRRFEERGKTLCRMTHEAVAPESPIRGMDDPELNCITITDETGWCELRQGSPISLKREDLPPDMCVRWERNQIQSMLNIPIFIEGQWYGFAGFVDAIQPRDWSDDDIRLLKSASEMIGIFFYKQRVLADLEDANRRIREAQAQLVQTEKMASLGMLVAGVAHEINTPVGALTSMHDTLVRAVEKLKREIETSGIARNEQVLTALNVIAEANSVITRGADRVATIVRRLRSFARLDQAEMQKASIHDGIEDTLTLIHHEIKNRITVHRDFGDVPPIVCYPGQLNQVFLNLLVNASQAMPGGGDIFIKTGVREGKVQIEISDTGHGIPPRTLPRIFDPGFTTKGVGVGTGLGLSICYQIVQDHRGEIFAESEVGKGTKFTILLPMDLEATGRSAEEPYDE